MATSTATKSAEPKLNPEIFGVEVKNFELLKNAYLGYLANARNARPVSKKRGEVSGGGRKPWRQKGTGRARVGSIRSPLWRGGGITFGPTGSENHKIVISKQARRTAIKQALSLANKEGRLQLIPDLKVADGKTKTAVAALAKAGANGSTLVVVADKTPELTRSTSNIPGVKLVSAKYLNVYDTLNADTILLAKGSLSAIDSWLGGKSE